MLGQRFFAVVAILALGLLAVTALWLVSPAKTVVADHDLPCPDMDGDNGVTRVDQDIQVSYFFVDFGDPDYQASADLTGDGLVRAADFTAMIGYLGDYTLCQDVPFTWLSGTPPAKGGGTVDSTDLDGDGCTDAAENLADETVGGDRDYLNPWDFFNPSGDGFNDIGEVLTVVGQYFIDFPSPAYTTATDRTATPGGDLWDAGPPNGQQRVDDILGILRQYFHDCT
jgi:hypothetical protein